ncbi:MAG: hypothetical protein GX879_03030, partial [Bacteroidales bacterium]|nr:hypothetical protein [Bacteroidales bacterium]
ANEAIFKNNVYGIYMEPYSFSHTLSSMKNSEFITDVLFEKTNVKFPKAHIYLKGVKELYIYGNNFKNTIPYSPFQTLEQINPYYIECRGTGIQTTESHFSTSPITLGTSLTGTGNTFTGLYYGIHASGQKDAPVDIRYNVFDNNFRGVYVANGNGSRVIFNEINTSTEEGQLEMILFPFPNNGTPNSTVRYGAYLNSCTNFKFEENTIKYGTAGMYIYNTGEASGQKIYRNDFGITSFTSTLGTIVVGKNSDYITGNSNTGNVGLQINCNKYIKTDNAITVLNGNMRKTQGSSTNPVLNKFHKAPYSNGMEFKVQINTSTLPMWDFSKYDLGTYTYYQHLNSTNPAVQYNYQLTPGKYTAGKVSPYQTSVPITSLTCLSTFALDPGTGVIIPLMGAIGDFGDNLSDLEIEYSRIVDKGNEELMTSTAENMNNQNYVTSYQQLSNSGYLSDNVYSAIIENTKAPVAAKAAVLINNSPMPETSKQELESSTMDLGLKSLVMEYQDGVNSREQLEYQISDIKQEIASLEIDMISSVFYNEESQEDKNTLINYFASKTDGNYNDKLNAYKLQLSSNDYVSARASLQELRTLAIEIDEELAEEIERYCDINTIYLNSLKDNLIDTAVLT